jgi:AAA family ATP:ADP antiporter
VFAVFLAYYVLRPIRDELGVAAGVRNLPWLFTGTLVAMLLIHPLFAALVRRWSRERFISIAYRFFMLNLLCFALLLRLATPEQAVWVGRAFFIWVSVFNLFVVSIFWSLVVDVFDTEQGKRLFGVLAAGATVGGIAGSALTSTSVALLGQSVLLLISIVLLELAVFAARKLSRLSFTFEQRTSQNSAFEVVGGGILSGFISTFRSPYLLAIGGFILLYSLTSTMLYFQQASIAGESFQGKATRTEFFANLDLWVNVLTLVAQLLLTGRLTALLGAGVMLCALPLISFVGFALLASTPSVAVFVVVQVARRVANFAFARPARELLFTVLPREDRYKAKNFIDTVVYRGGDQLAGWCYAGLAGLGLGMTGIYALAAPLSLVWLVLAVWLGRQLRRGEHHALQPSRPSSPSTAHGSDCA